MSNIHPFFLNDQYFVDEKVRLLKIRNEYKVYDANANHIATVRQKMSTLQKVLQFIVNPALLPFHIDIEDTEGNVLVSIKRGVTLWLSKVSIETNQGVIGYIQQKFVLFKPKFEILSANDSKLAEVKGDWMAWNFTITNAEEKEIGTISKKWAGVAKELFTTADKYQVRIDQSLAEDANKVAIVSATFVIDMILKENKN